MRSKKIDLMRFIGISLIVLAHVHPPAWINEIRSFDVVLMVVTSALAFAQSRKQESYKIYLGKRINRLVFPMWLFLSFYFLLELAIAQLGFAELSTLRQILGSYTFIDGIGFVWIIRAFFLVSLVAPFIIKFERRISSNKVYLSILLIIYLVYQLLLSVSFTSNTFSRIILLNFVYFSIGFILVWSLGIRLIQLTKKEAYFLLTFFLSIYVALTIGYYLIDKEITYISTLKYPPTYPPSINYLSYGLGMTILVYLLIDNLREELSGSNLKLIKQLVFFISRNTMWVYLWHIPLVRFFEMYPGRTNFLLEYFIVYLIAVTITFIQVMFVNKILLSVVKKESLKKKIKIIFTG